jgi:hypothetical protein
VKRSIVLVLAFALVLASPAAAQQSEGNGTERGITVVGEATGFADNDIAQFRFGVTVRRRSATRALRAASAVQRRVIGRLRASGVAAADIQSDVISVSRTARPRERPRRGRFLARNAIAVTIRRVDRAGQLVATAVRAGATSVDGPRFSVSDLEGAYRRVLGLAFADARAKAERLAAEAGVALGPAVRIVERRAIESDDLFSASSGGDDEGRALEVSAPRVEAGRTEIEAGVVVTFATG